MALVLKKNMNGLMQTELGFFLPKEWDLSTLDEIFSIQQGKALSQKNQGGESPQPFLRTANILWGCLNLNKVDQMDFNDKEVKRLALKPNDLLICEGGDIGRTAIWNGEIDPCFYQNHIHRLRLIRTDVEPQFIMFWMQAAIELLGLYQGEGNKTTIPNLSKARLSKFLVPLPPLHEQRAIARALRAVQAAREARLREIALERERKAALMEHLFTHGARGEPTKMTDIGEMPESWEVIKLCKLADIVYGVQAAVANLTDNSLGIPILTNINISNEGRLDTSILRYYELPENKGEKLKLRKGDLLFNWRSGSNKHIGKTALFDLDGEYTFSSFILRFRVKNLIINKYLLYYLHFIKSRGFFEINRQQSSVNSVFNASKAAELLVSLPLIEEQERISNILANCDCMIFVLNHEARLLDELFRTMLVELMSGKLPAKGLIES